MTRDADVSDFVARDEDSDPLLVDSEIELGEDTVTIEAIPATRGFLNELDNMDASEVEDEGMKRVLGKFRTPDFRNGDGTVPDDTVDKMPMNRLGTLFDEYLVMSGIDRDKLDEATQEGNEATA